MRFGGCESQQLTHHVFRLPLRFFLAYVVSKVVLGEARSVGTYFIFNGRACWPVFPLIEMTGEQYSTTYEAAGPVTLAVMGVNDFHACTDRAIVNKSNTSGVGGGSSEASVT